MWTWIRRLLLPPHFDDEEKTRVARLLNTVLVAFFAAMMLVAAAILALVGVPATMEDSFTLIGSFIVAVAVGGLLLLARRGYLRAASTALLSLIWVIITGWIAAIAGIGSDTSPLGYPIIIVLAGLLLGGRAALVFTLLSGLAVLGAYFAEASGNLIVVERELTLMDPFLMIVQLGLTGLLLRHAVHSLTQALDRARTNEAAQAKANRELEALRESLEERVAHRTLALERRTSQLQAAADVSRAATSILEAEQLMWQVARLLHERFELYHVGLFQLDTVGRWAVYLAGAGEGALALSEQRFRLEVGGDSLVGWCTMHAQARIIQDVQTDQIRYDHPLVPETRSEAALPLIARGQVIGAMSAQSETPGFFDADTAAILQTIADQVAVALDNARLFGESQQALEATRRAYGEMTRQTWVELLRARADWGYRYTQQSTTQVGGDWQPDMIQALQTGQIVEGGGNGEAALAIPLRVRDEVVGVLSFFKDTTETQPTDAGHWTAEETRLLEQLIQQLGLALESAQFYEETQHRAVHERTAREVTARMRETLDVDTVLRTAAEEMRQALGLSAMTIRLATSQESPID